MAYELLKYIRNRHHLLSADELTLGDQITADEMRRFQYRESDKLYQWTATMLDTQGYRWRWTADGKITVVDMVALAVLLKMFAGYRTSLHFNAGTHGTPDGDNAGTGQGHCAEGFLLYHLVAMLAHHEISNASAHMVSSQAPAISPWQANHVIDGWCYSTASADPRRIYRPTPPRWPRSRIEELEDGGKVEFYRPTPPRIMPPPKQPATDAALVTLMYACGKENLTSVEEMHRKYHPDLFAKLGPYSIGQGGPYRRGTALHFACAAGLLPVVEKLLSFKIDVDVEDEVGETPLYTACKRSRVPVVELLVRRCEQTAHKVLFHACRKRDAQVVQTFIEAYPPQVVLSRENGEGFTALRMACSKNNLDIIKLLLPITSEQKNSDDQAWSPLLWAAEEGNVEVARELIRRGVNRCSRSKTGLTALHHASEKGHFEMVQLLVEKVDCRVDVQTDDGSTPLSLARRHGHTDIANYLAARERNSVSLLNVQKRRTQEASTQSFG